MKPVVFLWFSHGFPMTFLWFSYDSLGKSCGLNLTQGTQPCWRPGFLDLQGAAESFENGSLMGSNGVLPSGNLT